MTPKVYGDKRCAEFRKRMGPDHAQYGHNDSGHCYCMGCGGDEETINEANAWSAEHVQTCETCGVDHPYPEHAKAVGCQRECEIISEFLEFLTQRYAIVALGSVVEAQPLAAVDPADLVAECFGIDRKKLEAEKRAMAKAATP